MPGTNQAQVTITDRAAAHIVDVLSHEPTGSMLRVSVSGGGCSGFQYNFTFDTKRNDDDLLLCHAGAPVLIDAISLPYMAGAEIDFTDDLIGQSFQIRNPNASASCGCGTSFSI